MDVQILGPLRVLRDGTEVETGAPKQRLLLAVLACSRGETVSVDRLVDELWGAAPPPRVASSVQAYVSKLRLVLEPDRPARTPPSVLVTRAPGYALLLEPEQLDAWRFAEAAEQTRGLLAAGRYERAYEVGRTALGWWRGEVLEDLGDEPVARRERPRLEELRAGVVEDHLEAAVELGLHVTAINDLEALLGTNPLRERAIGLLVRSLYLSGRPVEALERYRVYRTQLQDELGLVPGSDLRALETAILQQDPALAPAARDAEPAVRDPAVGASTPTEVVGAGAVSVGQVATDERDLLVGRGRELHDLRGVIADVRAGVPRWVTLAGEAGIGKTRLAEEIAVLAREAGLEVAWGRCHEDDDAPPYWPWTQLLRSFTGADTDPIADVLAEPDLPADPGARRYHLHERVADLLRGGRRLVVLDDVQWADPASLQLLAFLAVQLHEGGIGIVSTLRTGVDRPELRASMATVARHSGAVRHDLRPLTSDELAELATAVTGAPLERHRATALHERTAGNPFFATELLRLPADREGDWQLPAAVREVIERRLAPLGDEARAVLDLAAVVGGAFDLSLVEGASGAEPDRLFDTIDVAVAAGLVVVEPAGGFRFAHPLVREALLADLSPLRRQRLHGRIADALERHPRRDEARQAAESAHHLAAAVTLVGLDRAHAAVRAAAAAAAERLASLEAASWWRTGADLIAQHGGDPRARHQDLVDAGRALLLAGRTEEGREVLVTAMDEAATRGEVVAAAEAAIAVGTSGGAWFWVEPGESPTELVRRMESALRGLGDEHPAVRVRLLGVIAPGVYYADPEHAARLVREGLALARRTGDAGVHASALVDAMACEWNPSTRDRHLALCDELLALPAEARPPMTDASARLYRMNVHLERGELTAADAELEVVADIADAARLHALRAQVGIARVGLAWAAAEPGTIEEAIDQAAELHRSSGLYRLEAVRLVNQAPLRLLQGRLGEVAEALPELLDVGFGRELCRAWIATAHEDHGEAVRCLERGDTAPRPGTWQWLPSRVLRSLAVVEVGACELAPPLLEDLRPQVGTILVAGLGMTVLGPLELHVGRLEELVGDLDAAENHLRMAAARGDDLGSPIWGTLARAHLASVLERAGRAGETAPWLGDTIAAARELGLAPAAARAERVRDAAATSPEP
jgi:DNA-binding SARP family transcriptional activator